MRGVLGGQRAAVPFPVPREAAFQPPPSAWMSATLAVRRFWRMVSSVCASASAWPAR